MSSPPSLPHSRNCYSRVEGNWPLTFPFAQNNLVMLSDRVRIRGHVMLSAAQHSGPLDLSRLELGDGGPVASDIAQFDLFVATDQVGQLGQLDGAVVAGGR